MQGLKEKGIEVDAILADYDLILIPEWVLAEINDAEGRADYVQQLIDEGHPIYSIAEEKYSDLVNNEEGNLYQIVLASTYQIGRIKSYLWRFVEKDDLLDMDEYKDWINKLYDEWPIPGPELSSGRVKKKVPCPIPETNVVKKLMEKVKSSEAKETLKIADEISDMICFYARVRGNIQEMMQPIDL